MMERNPNVTERQVARHGDFEVATARSADGKSFLSWAKLGRIMGDCPITEPGAHVWFNGGPTREIAKARLLAELGLPT